MNLRYGKMYKDANPTLHNFSSEKFEIKIFHETFSSWLVFSLL